MARINIEDDLFKRGDWMNFLILCGDQDKALGAFVRACMVAQKYWFPSRQRIPRAAWDSEGLSAHLITSKLADENSEGIFLKGTDKAFAWLFEMSDKGKKGGKKSAEVRANKKENKKRSVGQPQSSVGQAEVNLSEASLLSPLYSSLSTHNSDSSSNSKLPADSKNPRSGESFNSSHCFISKYKEMFSNKYGSEPECKGREYAFAKRITAGWDSEKIGKYLLAFFTMPDAYLVKSRHPIALFETKINEITVYANSQNFMTMSQVRDADSHASNLLLLNKVRQKEAASEPA